MIIIEKKYQKSVDQSNFYFSISCSFIIFTYFWVIFKDFYFQIQNNRVLDVNLDLKWT